VSDRLAQIASEEKLERRAPQEPILRRCIKIRTDQPKYEIAGFRAERESNTQRKHTHSDRLDGTSMAVHPSRNKAVQLAEEIEVVALHVCLW
jgi:hypothetical protein